MSRILTGNTNATGTIQPTSLSNTDTLVGNVSGSYVPVTASASTPSSTQTTRGVVHSQDAPPLSYTGVDSDSASVFVDNNEQTIQATVKIQSLLGHTPSTAFPGNEGLRNTQDIEKLQSSIASCLDTVNTLVQENKIHTDTMTTSMAQLESLVEEYKVLCTSITSATQSSLTAVNQATSNLSKKITQLESKIASNQSQTNVLLSEESSSRAVKDEELRVAIVDETSRATKAEVELRSLLGVVSTDSRRALSELDVLKGKAVSLNTMIESIRNSTELTQTLPELEAQASKLQQDLEESKHVTSQQLASIKSLLDRVGVVAHNALIQSSGHDADIADLQKTEGTLKTSIAEIETDTKNFTKEFRTTAKLLTTLIETLQSTVAFEKLNRDEHDELQDVELEDLNTRVSDLQTNLTELIHNIRKELKQMDEQLEDTITNIRYDFIDGGTAPV